MDDDYCGAKVVRDACDEQPRPQSPDLFNVRDWG